MTHEEHRQRHLVLHQMFDELLADYARHHPGPGALLTHTLDDLMTWSYQQTQDPTEILAPHEACEP